MNNEIYVYLQNNWGAIVSFSAAWAAASVFIRNVLTIQKLRLEIRKLKSVEKTENANKEKLLRQATREEVEKYGRKYSRNLIGFSPPSRQQMPIEQSGVVPLAGVLSLTLFGLYVILATFIESAWFLELLISVAIFLFTWATVTFVLNRLLLSLWLSCLDNESERLS